MSASNSNIVIEDSLISTTHSTPNADSHAFSILACNLSIHSCSIANTEGSTMDVNNGNKKDIAISIVNSSFQTNRYQLLRFRYTNNLFIRDCVFNNSPGMIELESSSLSMHNSIINNSALLPHSVPNYGGGISSRNSSPINITNCLFINNIANYLGGAIYVNNSQNTFMRNVTLLNNRAQKGGAIYIENSKLQLNLATISLNNAQNGAGGGIYADNVTINIQQVKISSNNASIGGGIFLTNSSYIEGSNNTIINNSAKEYSGGFYCYYSNAAFKYSHSLNNTVVNSQIIPKMAIDSFCFHCNGCPCNEQCRCRPGECQCSTCTNNAQCNFDNDKDLGSQCVDRK